MVDDAQRASDRIATFLAGGAPSYAAGPISINATSFGDADEWRGSAIVYLKATLAGTRGGSLGGMVLVSAAAIGCVVSYVEALQTDAGIIAPGAGGGA